MIAFTGMTRCPVVMSDPSSPNAAFKRNSGTGNQQGLRNAFPSVLQKTAMVTGEGATALSGPDTVDLVMAHSISPARSSR